MLMYINLGKTPNVSQLIKKFMSSFDLFRLVCSFSNLRKSFTFISFYLRVISCIIHPQSLDNTINFLFNRKFNDQIDALATESPLAPVLSNLFMGHNEKFWLENFQGTPRSYYKRYADDIFSVFDNNCEANEFFNYIHTRHPNIKFTMETEIKKIILF